MELHQVKYFLALARSLNFTRAAEQCNVTQPALTKAVQKLEAELGGVLVHRERQLTQLTELGKLVLPMFERTYNAAEAVRLSAEGFQRKEIASLRIALAPCVSAALLEGPLAKIARFMPGLRIELVDAEPEMISDMLLNGDVGAAVCGNNVGVSYRLDHWDLVEERILVLVPRDSAIATSHEVPIGVLEQADWLEHSGPGGDQAYWKGFLPEGWSLRVAHRGRSLSHLQHMVSAGLGIMLWPEHAPHPASLVTRRVAGDRLRRKLLLQVVAGRRHPPALEALVKIARVHDWQATFPTAVEPCDCLTDIGGRGTASGDAQPFAGRRA